MSTTIDTHTDTNGSHIELNDTQNVVHVKDLKISSKEVYQHLAAIESPGQREEEFKRALEVGVAVLQKVQLVSDTDYFEKRVRQLSDTFEGNLGTMQRDILQAVEKSFDPAEAKSYTKQLNDFFLTQKREIQAAVKDASEAIGKQKDALEGLIDESFDADDKQSHLGKLVGRIDLFDKEIQDRFNPDVKTSVISKLQQNLESVFSETGSLAKILDERISVSKPGSPLLVFKEEIKKEIAALREDLAKEKGAVEAQAEAIKKSPEKGYVFEDAVEAILQQIAKADGDVVENVSLVKGETKRKSGDFTFACSKISKKIVVESRSTPITSVSIALRDLQSSMQNRSAEYGIYVVETEDQLQKQIGIWNEYPDNRIITHVALLEVAIKVAKARLALTTAIDVTVDTAAVRASMDKITASLKKLSSIKKEVTAIRDSSGNIEKLAGEVQVEIKGDIEEIDGKLVKALQDSEPGDSQSS